MLQSKFHQIHDPQIVQWLEQVLAHLMI